MSTVPATERLTIQLTVNGEPRRAEVEPRTLLSDLLREHLGLTGTNLGCEHGYCGACTVIVDGQTARSCLMLAATADGSEVRTVEGLASDPEHLAPLQIAFQEHHGLQCGYCTPGILMTATELLESGEHLDEQEVRRALAGNICRCTGYVHIVEAILAAADERRES
jgi:aerobic-type carbon monoxide dehydrogenase small subunit (CoxS/CutS family)